MIKIITWINFGFFIAGIASLSFVYVKRTEFVNDMLFTIQDQVIENMQNSIKTPSLPSSTGPVNPFSK